MAPSSVDTAVGKSHTLESVSGSVNLKPPLYYLTRPACTGTYKHSVWNVSLHNVFRLIGNLIASGNIMIPRQGLHFPVWGGGCPSTAWILLAGSSKREPSFCSERMPNAQMITFGV